MEIAPEDLRSITDNVWTTTMGLPVLPWLLETPTLAHDAALAGATPFLRLFGNAAGGCMLAEQALASLRAGNGAGRTVLARFFAENLAVQATGLERSVTEGAESVTGAQAALEE